MKKIALSLVLATFLAAAPAFAAPIFQKIVGQDMDFYLDLSLNQVFNDSPVSVARNAISFDLSAKPFASMVTKRQRYFGTVILVAHEGKRINAEFDQTFDGRYAMATTAGRPVQLGLFALSYLQGGVFDGTTMMTTTNTGGANTFEYDIFQNTAFNPNAGSFSSDTKSSPNVNVSTTSGSDGASYEQMQLGIQFEPFINNYFGATQTNSTLTLDRVTFGFAVTDEVAPIPEPGVLLLFATGAALLAYRSRKNRCTSVSGRPTALLT